MGINRSATRQQAAAPSPAGGNMRTAADVASTMRGAVDVKSWTPTVANLIVLLVLELAAYAGIRYLFRRL